MKLMTSSTNFSSSLMNNKYRTTPYDLKGSSKSHSCRGEASRMENICNMKTTSCVHELTWNRLCVACGTEVEEQQQQGVSLDWLAGTHGFVASGVNSIRSIFENDFQSMIRNQKLRLVLDLDETLIHSVCLDTEEELNRFNEYRKQLYSQYLVSGRRPQIFTYTVYSSLTRNHCTPINYEHYQQYHRSQQVQVEQFETDCFTFVLGSSRFVVFLRPYLCQFLQAAGRVFDIYMYTNGTERYASVIQQHLATMFQNNYIQAMFSRKTQQVREKKQLFKMLCKRSISIVVDDRTDVWCNADKPNVVQVTPYVYTGFLNPTHQQQQPPSEEEENDDSSMQDENEENTMVDDTDEDLLDLSDYLLTIHQQYFYQLHHQDKNCCDESDSLPDVRTLLTSNKFKQNA